MKGRSRKGCVMGTSIHKNKASSPVKFLGGMVDSVKQEYENIRYGHLPPPTPERMDPTPHQAFSSTVVNPISTPNPQAPVNNPQASINNPRTPPRGSGRY